MPMLAWPVARHASKGSRRFGLRKISQVSASKKRDIIERINIGMGYDKAVQPVIPENRILAYLLFSAYLVNRARGTTENLKLSCPPSRKDPEYPDAQSS